VEVAFGQGPGDSGPDPLQRSPVSDRRKVEKLSRSVEVLLGALKIRAVVRATRSAIAAADAILRCRPIACTAWRRRQSAEGRKRAHIEGDGANLIVIGSDRGARRIRNLECDGEDVPGCVVKRELIGGGRAPRAAGSGRRERGNRVSLR